MTTPNEVSSTPCPCCARQREGKWHDLCDECLSACMHGLTCHDSSPTGGAA